jgi:protein gp37
VHPDWVRGVRDQCQAAGVPFFFKQWGDEKMTDAYVYHVGKKAAGHLLDGVEYRQVPEVLKPFFKAGK